jgi:opacity protein-like surface antigen
MGSFTGGFKALVTAAVGGLVLTAGAQAADPAGTFVPEVKKEFYTDLISGWYVRGDLGYSMPTIGSVQVPAPQVVTQWELQNSVTLGLGGGYKHHWFRADVTVDYANRGRFQGDTAAVQAYYTAKIDSFTILANVYLDLGTWGGFTPYVGAGVGTTHLRTHEYTNITIIEPWQGVEDTTRWNFSWAAMGGVAFRFSPKGVVDLGYRYLKLGDAVSGTEPLAHTDRTYLRDIKAHEFRIGLRWMLD